MVSPSGVCGLAPALTAFDPTATVMASPVGECTVRFTWFA